MYSSFPVEELTTFVVLIEVPAAAISIVVISAATIVDADTVIVVAAVKTNCCFSYKYIFLRSARGRRRVKPPDGSSHCLGSPATNTPGDATFYIRCKFTSVMFTLTGN